jgi:hypothetical protein
MIVSVSRPADDGRACSRDDVGPVSTSQFWAWVPRQLSPAAGFYEKR